MPATFIKLMNILVCKKEHDEHTFYFRADATFNYAQ